MATSQTLAKISAAKAKDFLETLANLQDDAAAIGRFRKRFGEILPEPSRTFVIDETEGGGRTGPYSPLSMQLGALRETVRAIWREPDARTREWGLFRLRYTHQVLLDPGFAAAPEGLALRVPPPTSFEQCILYFAKFADKARYCANPECLAAPYFFAARRNQKYCSSECAQPAQREFKRAWWAEHGEVWRRNRRRKKSRKRR